MTIREYQHWLREEDGAWWMARIRAADRIKREQAPARELLQNLARSKAGARGRGIYHPVEGLPE